MTQTDTSNLTIGTLDEAEDALLMFTYNRMLDGWRRLGQGIHRCAYLSPSGVVYKVPTPDYGCEADEASRKEYKAVVTLRNQVAPEGFGVPNAGIVDILDKPILAMEFIDGDPAYLDGPQHAVASRFYRNTDLHCGNVVTRKSDGLIYMIDLGFFDANEDNGDGNCDCGCMDNQGCGNCGGTYCDGVACMACTECAHNEWSCVCCFQCGAAPGCCGCCADCGEREGDCCCDFCPNCTRHKEDCRGNCECPMDEWECAFLGRKCDKHA